CRQLAAAARLAGGPAAARAALRAAGYLLKWRLSGPWGRAPELDLARALGPETRPLGPSNRTGHGWDLVPRPTWRGVFADGEVLFFDIDEAGGVGFAEADVAVEAPAGVSRRVVLRVEANRPVAAFFAGAEVLPPAPLSGEGPWERRVALGLPEAGGRLTIKLATWDGRGFFRARLVPLDPRARVVAGAPTRDEAPTVLPAPPALVDRWGPGPPPVGDAAAAIRGLVALSRLMSRPLRDVEAARARLSGLEAALGDYPGLLPARARLARIDPRLPKRTERREVRAALEAFAAVWPTSGAALRGLARLDLDEERRDAALRRWQAARELAPDDPLTLLDLLGHAKSRGWEAEALALAAALRPHAAESPRVAQELVDVYRAFGRVDRARAAAEALEATFPGAGITRLAVLDGDAGDHRAQARRLEGLWRLEPHRLALLRQAVAAWRAAGDLDAAAGLVAELLRDRPHDGWALGERIRVALEAGDGDAVAAGIDDALAQHPDFGPVESLGDWLAGRAEPLDAIADGRAVVARWLSTRGVDGTPTYEAHPVVNLLERKVIDVRRDGSTVEQSHRVRLVQTKAAADSLGDVRPPEGARILAVRTLKADGRVLWPEIVRGKRTLSLPELEPGDAVETAWVTRSRVRPGEGGYLSAFVMASASVPTVALSAEVKVAKGLELHWRSFGGAPGPTSTQVGADGATTTRWALSHLPALPREPLSVGARGFYPFVDLRIARAGRARPLVSAWAAISEAYAARLARLAPPGPRVREVAATLAAAEASPLGRARAAVEWVKEEIDDGERFNAMATSAESAVAQGKGSRALALLSLGRALGLDTTLWFCTPEQDGTPPDDAAPSPNANRFFYPVVRFVIGDAVHVADVSRLYAPLDTLPFELYGARCLVPTASAEGLPLARLPGLEAYQGPTLGWALTVALTLDAEGAAKGRVSGRGYGPPASGLRQLWLNQDEQRQHIIWQQWAATLFPGARVTADKVVDARDANRPVSWLVDVEVPGYAAGDGDERRVTQLVKPLLASELAAAPKLTALIATPARGTPLRVSPHVERLALTVQAPPGWRWASTPPDVDVSVGPHRLRQTVVADGPTLTLSREIALLPGRVDPASYPAFRAAIEEAIRAFEAGARL
ncbi:MAG: hypothetical protein CSA66_00460, partial [Proteobacteria bacterium]